MQCLGWWEQQGFGRQPMGNLSLSFTDQHVSGGGSDIIGEFTLEGDLQSDGSIVIHKHYLGKHTVFYDGQYDGEGTFYGTWDIHGLHGNWSIRLQNLAV